MRNAFFDEKDQVHTAPFALVAGGSKGIGYAIAKGLAIRNFNLVLIARNYEGLAFAKAELESLYHIQIYTLIFDLSLPNAASEIAQWCIGKNIQLKMLCNVAGLGGAKDYLSLPLEEVRRMIHLNLESAVSLCATLLPLLERNAPAYILNVASMAGFAPIPSKNIYSATKSAVVFFSYSLRYQLMHKSISVSCLCPGPVFTKPSIEQDTKNKLGWFGIKMAVSPEKVGEIAVQKTLAKSMIIEPGSISKITSFLLRFLPKRIVSFAYGKLGEKK